MTRRVGAVVISSLLFFCLLYWGFDTKAPQTGTDSPESVVQGFVNESLELVNAKESLSGQDLLEVEQLEQQLRQSATDTLDVDILKSMASVWIKHGQFLLSGLFAQQIAEQLQTAESWGIAGTTYLLGLKQSGNRRELFFSRAVYALENAISLDPEQMDHRINLALAYVEQPEANNPMRGIQMLLDLNKRHPENIEVLVQLARLGLQTNQVDNAFARLQAALAIDPENADAICLMAEVTNVMNHQDRQLYRDKCELLKNKM